MSETMNKEDEQEQIKQLYHKLYSKTEFMNDVAIHFNRSIYTAKTWFAYQARAVPKRHRKQVIKLLQEKIKQQDLA